MLKYITRRDFSEFLLRNLVDSVVSFSFWQQLQLPAHVAITSVDRIVVDEVIHP